ncbi:MAG: putative lipoprotein NlpE involved in copper resistance [Akkermansiaceae bacterium]|jgi:hypothetical protein
MTKVITLLFFVLIVSSCQNKPDRKGQVIPMLQSISEGKTPASFTGRIGDAVKILREKQGKQDQGLV